MSIGRHSLRLRLIAALAFAIVPASAAMSGICPTPPAESQRFRPLTATPPDPWPAATVRRDHPRLFFDAAHLRRFRAHWRDPAYASIVHEYKYDTTLNPVFLALRGLAENDSAACRLAAQTVASDAWHAQINLSSGPPGGTNWKLFGPPQYLYGDAEPFVFDWCYAALTPALKARLVAKIDAQNAFREASLNKHFQWHEAHFSGFHAYLLGVLAIAGEPGAPDRLQQAQNAVQNWTALGNELHGDGGYKTYSYQDTFLIAPAILWSLATGQDAVHRNRFILHHAEFLLRRLSQDGTDFVAGPGDQAADARGMIIRLQDPSPLGVLMAADYLRDGFAQWLGQFLLEKQGFGQRWDSPRWLDLIFHDDALTPVPPARADIPLVRHLTSGGMVDMRSGWNIGRAGADDIDAWFYLGPMTEHAESDAGHFTLWRGNDDLLTEGANYLSRPTRYHLQWSVLSLARNTDLFTPADSSRPDLEGSELPVPTSIYDDGRMFGDIGAERVLEGENEQARHRLATLSAEAYPVANRLVWYPEYAAYQGRIVAFHDDAATVSVTGDATAAYDPRHVVSFFRDVVDVKPDTFIIHDRFRLNDVARVRMVFHTREHPDAAGLHLVQGINTAGILEGTGNRVTVTRGGSESSIQVLWPAGTTIRLVGGPGYENYRDGKNIDGAANTVDWLLKQPDFPARIARIRGSWRVEIETTPQAAAGDMIIAITAGPRGFHAPQWHLTRDAAGDHLSLRRESDPALNVELPGDESPHHDIDGCAD